MARPKTKHGRLDDLRFEQVSDAAFGAMRALGLMPTDIEYLLEQVEKLQPGKTLVMKMKSKAELNAARNRIALWLRKRYPDKFAVRSIEAQLVVGIMHRDSKFLTRAKRG